MPPGPKSVHNNDQYCILRINDYYQCTFLISFQQSLAIDTIRLLIKYPRNKLAKNDNLKMTAYRIRYS